MELTPEQILHFQQALYDILDMENGKVKTEVKSQKLIEAQNELLSARLKKMKSKGKVKVTLDEIVGALSTNK